jgi:hypothetical protein
MVAISGNDTTAVTSAERIAIDLDAARNLLASSL